MRCANACTVTPPRWTHSCENFLRNHSSMLFYVASFALSQYVLIRVRFRSRAANTSKRRIYTLRRTPCIRPSCFHSSPQHGPLNIASAGSFRRFSVSKRKRTMLGKKHGFSSLDRLQPASIKRCSSTMGHEAAYQCFLQLLKKKYRIV